MNVHTPNSTFFIPILLILIDGLVFVLVNSCY